MNPQERDMKDARELANNLLEYTKDHPGTYEMLTVNWVERGEWSRLLTRLADAVEQSRMWPTRTQVDGDRMERLYLGYPPPSAAQKEQL